MKLGNLFATTKQPSKSHQPGLMEATKPTHVPKEFSFNTTILGRRLWIKGDAHLLDNGTVTAFASTVWDKDLRLSVEVREGTPLYVATEERLKALLADKTFHNYLVFDCSIHFNRPLF